jgi:nitroreductase
VLVEATRRRPDSSEEFEALLRGRWSCRAFLPDPVPRAEIERMLTLAQQAPSWCNTQPWHVEVTTAAATERFRSALVERARIDPQGAPDFPMPEAYSGLFLERRRATGWQLYEAVGVARGDRTASRAQAQRNFTFFDAPHVAIVTTASEQGVYGAVDGGVYIGVLLLAARAVGLAAVAQAALARHSAFIRDHFGLEDDRRVLAGVAFGYPDESHPANSFRTSRAPLREAVRFHDE